MSCLNHPQSFTQRCYSLFVANKLSISLATCKMQQQQKLKITEIKHTKLRPILAL